MLGAPSSFTPGQQQAADDCGSSGLHKLPIKLMPIKLLVLQPRVAPRKACVSQCQASRQNGPNRVGKNGFEIPVVSSQHCAQSSCEAAHY